jgi:hypothetical protein
MEGAGGFGRGHLGPRPHLAPGPRPQHQHQHLPRPPAAGRKQRLLLCQAAYLSALLHAVATRHGNLLGYVPTFYAECVLESLAVLRRAEPPFPLFAPVQQLQQHGLGAPLALLVLLLNDGRIANPDIKEAVLQCISGLLGSPAFMQAFEQSPEARARLVPAALAVFDSRMWHPASQVCAGWGLGGCWQAGAGPARPACALPLALPPAGASRCWATLAAAAGPACLGWCWRRGRAAAYPPAPCPHPPAPSSRPGSSSTPRGCRGAC